MLVVTDHRLVLAHARTAASTSSPRSWARTQVSQQTLIEALAWQVVRTRAFRAWDEQVGEHLFPPLWATEAVDWGEERYGRPLTPEQRLQVFHAALRGSPVIGDHRPADGASLCDLGFRARAELSQYGGAALGAAAIGPAVAGGR
ncbi:hypothetical protein ACFYOI_36675 [Streptomyces microflavus]|uniref:hypothetical protein n=1 Tax=Streptomyces microflavus TaxID=1919 RepID=UPI0033A36F64